MSEEQSTETTETQQTPAASSNGRTSDFESDNSGSSPDAASKSEPSGYDRVEFTPEQKARFDRVYGQMKAQDRKIAERDQVLREQSEVIAELQKNVGTVVNHLNAQTTEQSVESARESAQVAFNKGDSKAYLAAMEKVASLQAQKIAQDILRQQQPQRQQVKQANNAVDVANRAVQQGFMSPQDEPAFEAWQDEKDASGNLVRPWAKRETAGDSFDSALMRSASVFADPKLRHVSIEQKLAEVDRIMGVSTQSPQQNVMAANLTQKPKGNNVKVSADMERVLNHLKPRGSKAKNAPDPIAWYREQANKAKSLNGARR